MYRKRRCGSHKYNLARERAIRSVEARNEKRLAEPPPDYPLKLPELRRKIIITDYDFGEPITHEILLYRTNRVDCYQVCVDGQKLAGRFGWARVLEKIRKAFIRISNFA